MIIIYPDLSQQNPMNPMGFYQGLDPQKDRRGQDRRLRGDAAALRAE